MKLKEYVSDLESWKDIDLETIKLYLNRGILILKAVYAAKDTFEYLATPFIFSIIPKHVKKYILEKYPTNIQNLRQNVVYRHILAYRAYQKRQ